MADLLIFRMWRRDLSALAIALVAFLLHRMNGLKRIAS